MALDATPLLGLPTGVGAFCHGALAALALRPGLDVRAYAVSWRRRRLIESHLPQGVRAHQRPMPARPLHALWARRDRPPLEWFVGAIDVVHGTNFLVPPTRRAAAVVSVHDLTPLHHPELCNEATLAYPGLIRRALGRGALIHTDSAFVAGEVQEAFGADPSRVRVVNPGIPVLPVPAEAEAAAVLQRLLPAGRRRASAWPSARPSPARTCRGWCTPSTRWPTSTTTWLSSWPGPRGGGSRHLDAAIDAATNRERIVRTGWVTQPDLAALLARASVLAYPSLYEGFGFPPLQAMRAGVPVVATSAGSLPEVLGGAAALVEPGDHEGLVEALDRCLGDEEERRRLIAAGTAWSARYSWDRCGEGLDTLYRDAAASRG